MAQTYSFGEWVKQRRMALHMTQRQLALGASCAVATVKKIEADQRRPSAELAGLFAQALQLPAEGHHEFIETARGRIPVDRLPDPEGDEYAQEASTISSGPDSLPDVSSPLPEGTVTFLFTDIEGSSRLWEQFPQPMRGAIAQHDAILRAAVVESGGQVVKMRGDGLHAVFASAADAIRAAAAGQRELEAAAWDEATGPLGVRMGLHSGTAELRDGDYFGPAVNRAARLQDAGHGGQVLLSRVTAGLVRDQLAEGLALRDLGAHQIKDFPRPERIFQLVAADLRSDFPPLRAQSFVQGHLPSHHTSFIGRERELARAKELLMEGRLVTLIGPGGTGKTRLSVQVAAELQPQFEDGIWLAELAPLTDESMILLAIATLFSLQIQQGRPLEVVVADFLRGKEMLLILDNCEHLIEKCALLAEQFLDSAPSLKILASSRESLGVFGEMILRVPSLSLPQGVEFTAELLQRSEAAQLLVERARAVRSDFRITDDNAGAVAEICHRLDGIPLAIELAAARLRLFSPQQVAARLGDRFRLLTGGSRTAVPRQQTLQALIDWSYDLLDEEEKDLFRRLSVFVGGWTFEAAEVIGEGLDVLELLDQLVKKSLVQVEQEEISTRYLYLETIRQYARDRLFAAGEGKEVRDLHFAYFAQSAAEAELRMGGRRSAAIVAKLGSDMDNIRRAIEWGLGRDPVTTIDLMVGVLVFWTQQSGPAYREIEQWVQSAWKWLESVSPESWENVSRDRVWARTHLLTGQASFSAGEFEKVEIHLTKAIDLARSIKDKPTLMVALGLLSVLAAATRGTHDAEDEDAYAAAEECLALARELGFGYYESVALNVMGGYELARGNTKLGEAYLAASDDGSAFAAAVSQFQAAMMMEHIVGDSEAALAYLQEGRRRFQELNHSHFLALSNSEIGHIRRRLGEYSEAKLAYQETIIQFQWFGSRAAVANQLECFAFIAGAEEKWQRAAKLLGAAEALRKLINTDMLPRERREYEQEVTAVRAHLDEEQCQAAWRSGALLSMDQAIDFALADSD